MNTIRKNTTYTRLLAGLGVAALTLGLTSPAAFAELRKVEQTVYGMDCAPCAYGVEKNIKKLDGVQEVTVSLNEGNAVVELAKDNKVSIGAIRQAISDGGFTPKEAHVEVAGTLARKDGKLQLVTEDGTRYDLTSAEKAEKKAEKAWDKLRDAEEGTKLVLEGLVPTDKPSQIKVSAVSTA